MQTDSKKHDTPTDANNVLADSPLVNPYKGMRCNYLYDYCNPESCNCKKSSEWERKHNPYWDWVTYAVIKPPVGVEVLAQTDEWVSEDYNKKGIRVGFQNEDDNGPFVSAKWNNCSDTYEDCEEHKPVRWKFL
jgi:hypothetical protein